jgi:LuxR family transcriptional regulator, maltose regulon positive regulatory protein
MPPPENAPGLRRVPPSKIAPPALQRIVHRPRLLDIFKQNEDKKLILLIGQAAQGKSTAAAAYFEASSLPTSWINLGPEDSDPVSLYSLLVQVFLGESGHSRAAPLLALASRKIGPREALSSFREWTAHLFDSVDQPRQIFLDGLDHLQPQAESFRLLQALIEGLPPTTRLILLSRAYPPLQLDFQQMIMNRTALVLNNADLAFSPREIKSFFRETCGLSLTPGQVERVHRATEGWVGGMVLLSEALNKLSPGSPEKLLEGEWTDRFQKDTFQYFGQEIFRALTKAQQLLLLRSSVLENLPPALVRELFPDEDGEAVLQELTSRNLFVQAFPDPERGFVFRFHKLFRDFLATRFRSHFSSDEQDRWHLRIGACYAKQGDAAEAIPHFLAAKAYPQAVAGIRQEGLKRIQNGRLSELFGWLQGLPAQHIRDDPWLTLFQTLPHRFFAREEYIGNLKRNVSRFREEGDLSGLLLNLAYLIEAEFFLGHYHPGEIREAEAELERCPEGAYAYEKAFLWCQTGITQALRGNARRGYWACRNAYLLSRQRSDPLLEAVALCYGIYALVILGEFREADRLLKEAGPLCWNSPNAEIRFFYTLSSVAYHCFTGEARKAQDLCAALLEQTEKQGLAYLYPVALIHQQFALIYLHEYGQVKRLGNEIATLAAAMNLEFLEGAAEFYSGLGSYWAGDYLEAQEVINRSLSRFETGDSYSELHRVGARLARALLSREPDRRFLAIDDLREVAQYLEQIQSQLLLAECRLGLGVLFHDQGQPEQAKVQLHQGLALARRRGYRHFVIISPRDTVRACLLAQAYWEAGNPGADYARELLFRKYGPLAEEELDRLRVHPHPRVDQTVLALQRAIHRSGKPPLRISTFGGLRLFFGAEKMNEQDWERIQPRRLLAAILSRREERIHKEVLIEALWPEEKPGTGENNFKTTMQRLRRTLESEIDPRFGSSYIHLHQNLVFFDEELCRVDCREFEDLSREGLAREKAGDGKGALECYGRAVELYRGDFIPEEVYGPWAERRREDFRNIYSDLLLRSARHYEMSDSFKKAVACLKEALEADPLLEEASRRLMSLYAEKGMFNEALRTYEACRQALKAGLDTRPDPVTRVLYQGIRERARKS